MQNGYSSFRSDSIRKRIARGSTSFGSPEKFRYGMKRVSSLVASFDQACLDSASFLI